MTPLLSFFDAKTALLSAALTINESESLDTAKAFGRVLAEDLKSQIDVPGFDNSAMDGYALRISDLAKSDAGLPVSQRIPAGARFVNELEAGIVREHLAQPIAVNRMIVRENDLDGAIHGEEFLRIGISNVNSVPLPGADRQVKVPSNSRARSVKLASPSPLLEPSVSVVCSTSKPRPSS